MGRACGWVVCCLFPAVAALAAAGPARAGEPQPLKIGLPESMFSGVPQAVVQRASRPFQTMFEKQTGLNGEITVGRDYADLADQIRAGKIDVAVFHGFEYAWVRQNPELVPLVVTVPGAKLQACLVVNADSKATGPCDLKGEAVAVPSGTKAHCHIYFARTKEALPPECCGLAVLKGKSIEEALDAVSDGDCPAALVDATALATYQKQKPGAGARLKVLAQSTPFPPAIVVHRKDAFDAATAKKVSTGLVKGVETAEGQLLTSLWRLKGFAEPTAQYYADLDQCLKAYPAPVKK